ncbi:MAG: D-glycero-beta-D-manno-heptose-7-phosphate kinase [Gammaproteobacteria bacterium]|nr:D-glycero-beta-D-manno-heptose-7-phosphate kinase [Gammaproteobacteria bacterium]MBL6819430.1 D-glycero-beta-D-manno-heptose-7-phosphate kinase [Gammaproteobacteria bacterium]MBL6899048.1 D-glycero-beta-D-manno-heptose-7-phosphate kinase [Gammaproteobacteria bacterium]
MFKKRNILVIGDIMLDKYSHGNMNRISPEAPVPIVDINKVTFKPGGASNVAKNLSALGMNVTLLGITGDDPELKELIKVLRHTDIKFDPVKDITIRTTLKQRIIANDQHLIRLDHEDMNKSCMHKELFKKIIKYMKNVDIIILSDYDKGAVKPISQEVIEFANQKGVKVIIDPKGTDYSTYKGAYMVKPNEFEFSTIIGKPKNKNDMVKKGKQLMRELELESLLLTLGKNGMVLFSKDSVLTFPTSQKDVYDVTGAGDTVISVIAASLASNKSLKKSCELANVAAGLSIQHLGTVSISKSDISNAIKKS